MSIEITVSDSLKACGFDASDLDNLNLVVSASAEKTDDNLAAMEPLQAVWKRLLAKLPLTEVEDAEGNTTLRLDRKSNAYADFIKMARQMAFDRLTMSQRYVVTYAKVPTPTGALMWMDISTLKDADGQPVDIDPTKFRHWTSTGKLIDPRNRLKVDDPDLVDQVVTPLRKKFKQAASTAISRLNTRAGGGARTQDFSKKLERVQKAIKALYEECKKEEFEVGAEKSLNHILKQVGNVCGLGA